MKRFEAFCDVVRGQGGRFVQFDEGRDVHVARAPGRLDLCGGIADYSGSLVLEMPIAESTLVAVQRRPERVLTIESFGGETRAPDFELPIDAFEVDGAPAVYPVAAAMFAQDPSRHWAAYVAGAFLVLMHERGVTFDEGARILVSSNVPEGAGVSSSAALEVASMTAVAADYGIELSEDETARLCQRVENVVAGAPCGLMDQVTVTSGRAGHAVALVCQPADIEAHLPIPETFGIWGIDSGVRHSVAGHTYSKVRCAAFMGRRILEVRTGVNGYLANIDAQEFQDALTSQLPEFVDGEQFATEFGSTADDATLVEPNETYPVRAATAFPILENARARRFATLLRQGDPSSLPEIGALLEESHAGYSECGLGASGTDLLAEFVRESDAPLHGARVSGGGSGGTVVIVGDPDAASAVDAIAARYAEQTGHEARVFAGSSAGAREFGVRAL